MKTFTNTSSDGKTSLACYRTSCKSPRAMLQISHGMCEYFLRYTEFAEFLNDRGILVFGHDHLGHGSSVASPEDLGFTANGGGAEILVEDVHNLSLKMKQEFPSVPLILFGHSMGSFIAREALARYGSTYRAAVICGTGGPDMPAGAGRMLAKLLMLFFGERHRSRLLKKIAFAGYQKKIDHPRTPSDWLTRDESVVDRYLADPLCTYTFTLRAYHDLFTLVSAVSRKDWVEQLPKTMPVLIVSGEMDPVGSWGKGVKKVADRLSEADISTTLRIYPEMRHEILNEIGHEQVQKEIEQWLKTFIQ